MQGYQGFKLFVSSFFEAFACLGLAFYGSLPRLGIWAPVESHARFGFQGLGHGILNPREVSGTEWFGSFGDLNRMVLAEESVQNHPKPPIHTNNSREAEENEVWVHQPQAMGFFTGTADSTPEQPQPTRRSPDLQVPPAALRWPRRLRRRCTARCARTELTGSGRWGLRRLVFCLGPPVAPFYLFWKGSPTKIDYRKKGGPSCGVQWKPKASKA